MRYESALRSCVASTFTGKGSEAGATSSCRCLPRPPSARSMASTSCVTASNASTVAKFNFSSVVRRDVRRLVEVFEKLAAEIRVVVALADQLDEGVDGDQGVLDLVGDARHHAS